MLLATPSINDSIYSKKGETKYNGNIHVECTNGFVEGNGNVVAIEMSPILRFEDSEYNEILRAFNKQEIKKRDI